MLGIEPIESDLCPEGGGAGVDALPVAPAAAPPGPSFFGWY